MLGWHQMTWKGKKEKSLHSSALGPSTLQGLSVFYLCVPDTSHSVQGDADDIHQREGDTTCVCKHGFSIWTWIVHKKRECVLHTSYGSRNKKWRYTTCRQCNIPWVTKERIRYTSTWNSACLAHHKSKMSSLVRACSMAPMPSSSSASPWSGAWSCWRPIFCSPPWPT